MENTEIARWWQKSIIYQIYPRSFQDSNGDGVGDLRGIIQRLDYLKWLSVDAVWLSPIYPSPMADFGYDVTDYTDIDPVFGTMADFDLLLEEAQLRGIRVILDLVPNHTSDQHPWFRESRRSRDNPRRDWYVWRDPAPGGGPPNNWLSVFGGPAWTFDQATGQYYLRHFVPQQPDLNYRNPEVERAMLTVMRFWLDRGVDGFRVDVITRLVEDELFRDEPPDPAWDGVDPYYSLRHIYTKNYPGTHDVIRRIRALIDEYEDRLLVGETWVEASELMSYYGPQLDECHLPFNFQLIELPWKAEVIRAAVDAYEAALPDGAWPNWVLGNHDRHRIASRLGPAQARVAAMLLLTLRGTPTIYYGEELGMVDVPVPPERWVDPAALRQPEIAHVIGRDPVRTPMQWDASPNAGFTSPDVTPWLPVAANYQRSNVLVEDLDPGSTLTLFRRLLALRQSEPSLHAGSYASLDAGAEDVFAYLRRHVAGDTFLVVLNLGDAAHTLDVSGVAGAADVVLSSFLDRGGAVDPRQLLVRPNEGLVLRLGRETAT